jgi:protein-S-isoprenylcysteine O-methyltransferase Ste14
LLAGWLAAASAIDREIDVEEARLQRRFGAAYATYRDRVPRYLSTPRTRSPA